MGNIDLSFVNKCAAYRALCMWETMVTNGTVHVFPSEVEFVEEARRLYGDMFGVDVNQWDSPDDHIPEERKKYIPDVKEHWGRSINHARKKGADGQR